MKKIAAGIAIGLLLPHLLGAAIASKIPHEVRETWKYGQEVVKDIECATR
jgi:hypothetical protein